MTQFKSIYDTSSSVTCWSDPAHTLWFAIPLTDWPVQCACMPCKKWNYACPCHVDSLVSREPAINFGISWYQLFVDFNANLFHYKDILFDMKQATLTDNNSLWLVYSLDYLSNIRFSSLIQFLLFIVLLRFMGISLETSVLTFSRKF